MARSPTLLRLGVATFVVVLAVVSAAGTSVGARLASDPGALPAGRSVSTPSSSSASGSSGTVRPAGTAASTPLPTRSVVSPFGHPLVAPRAGHGTSPAAAPTVSSPFHATPAPMGVSDFGVGSGGAYAYETTGFEGTFRLTSFAAFSPQNATLPGSAAPNWVSLQLNAVAVNVSSSPGKPAGTFWVQNGIRFNTTTLLFEDNVWNFSSIALNLPASSLYGKIGSIHASDAGDYYAGVTSGKTLALPLTVELFTNITSTTGGHTVVSLSYYLHAGSTESHATYDVVTFNGSAPAAPSEFLVDGFTEDPVGSLYDAELVLGGNGDGTNSNVLDLAGSATLDRWNGTAGAYDPIRSAYDFGADSAETVLGVAVSYTGTTVHLSQGPSFLEGLWGTKSNAIAPTVAPGWIHVELTVTPEYAFAFATNATLAKGSLQDADYSYAPTSGTGALTTDLPMPAAGDPYVFSAWADGYATASVSVANNSTATSPASLTLTKSASTIDAPVYLLGTSEAQAFGAARATDTGYDAASGTLWLNASIATLAAPFLRLNYVDQPTFVLFATRDVNLTVKLNGYVQAPTSFTYSTSSGTGASLVGWTQGYFFYGGDGRFSVQNVSIEGVPPSTSLSHPPSTVQFYHDAGVTVANISASNAGLGVSLIDTTTVRAADLSASTGGIALAATGGSGIKLSASYAWGRNTDAFTSKVVSLNGTSTVVLHDLNVSDYAVAIASVGGSGLTVAGLNSTSNAVGFAVNTTDSGSVSNLTIGGATVANGGAWTFSHDLTFEHVTVNNGFGLDLTNDTTVSVDHGTALGLGSAVVAQFNDSSGGTFSDLTAEDGAAAVNLQSCSDITLADLTATDGSVGAFVNHSADVSGSGFTSTGLSVGLYVNATPGGTYSALEVSSTSVGAYVQNSSGVTISGVTATNATLGNALKFSNQSTVQTYPVAGVAVLNDSKVTIRDVSATNYPYAVWTNRSTHLAISSVTSWDGDFADFSNWTNDSAITQLFGYGDGVGVFLDNCTETNLSTSTLEASVSVGIHLSNGAHDTVDYNNFVANNASGVTGPFRLTHDQAFANGSSPARLATDLFADNYWSDRGAGAAYTINLNASVKDRSPLASFYGTYLQYTERGLPTAHRWNVLVSADNYSSNVSWFYIPGWTLAAAPIIYEVVPISGYPPSPLAGEVNWTGSDTSVTITFGAYHAPPPASSLPSGYVYAGIGAAVVAVAVVAVVLMRRKPPVGRSTPSTGSGSAGRSTPSRTGSDWSPDEGT